VANTSSLVGQCTSTRNLLMDLELLAHADYFVGTQKSALSPIIEVGFSYPSNGLGFRDVGLHPPRVSSCNGEVQAAAPSMH
jgi:hypothetical protein